MKSTPFLIINIEIGKGKSRQIHVFKRDNPEILAQNFIFENRLPETYLEPLKTFISNQIITKNDSKKDFSSKKENEGKSKMALNEKDINNGSEEILNHIQIQKNISNKFIDNCNDNKKEHSTKIKTDINKNLENLDSKMLTNNSFSFILNRKNRSTDSSRINLSFKNNSRKNSASKNLTERLSSTSKCGCKQNISILIKYFQMII